MLEYFQQYYIDNEIIESYIFILFINIFLMRHRIFATNDWL